MYLWHACDVFLALLGLPGVFSRPDSVVRTIILSKWQFWGQGLNFNAPGQGLAPRREGGAAEAAPRTVSPLARPPGGKCGLKWAKVCTTPLAQFSRPLLRSQVKSGPDRPEGCPRGWGTMQPR